MPFLSLNGFQLPVANASPRRRIARVGRRDRAFRRAIRDQRRGMRRQWDVELVVLDPAIADAVIAAIQGQGHFFDLRDGLQASTGLMPLPGVGSSVQLHPQSWGYAGRGVARIQSVSEPLAIRYDAQLGAQWTVLWRSWSGMAWHGYAKVSSGVGYADGVRDDTIGEAASSSFQVSVAAGIVSLGTSTAGPGILDDLVVLPYAAPDALLAAWTAIGAPKFGPCPTVHLTGDMLPGGDAWCVGEITDVRFIQKPNLLQGFGWVSNAKVISATFTEEEPAFGFSQFAVEYSTPAPPGNPAFWFDGQNVEGSLNTTLADGTQVQTWVDRGSRAQNANAPAAGNRPIFRRIGEVGLLQSSGAVRFDGVDDYIQTGVGAVIATPITVAVVFRHEATGAYRWVNDGVTAGGRLGLDQFTVGNVHELYQGVFQAHPSVTVSAGMWNASVATYQAAGSPWRLNGVDATVSPGGLNSVAGITLGAQYTGANPLNGYVVEFIAWADQSFGSFTAIADYLAKKYGILPQT